MASGHLSCLNYHIQLRNVQPIVVVFNTIHYNKVLLVSVL